MEGIPLQLIIVVVIGVAALGILVGWLALAGDPDPTMKSVDVAPETVKMGTGAGRLTKQVDFTVFVYDTKGGEVDDVILTFSGAVDTEVTQVLAKSGDKVKVTVSLPDGESSAVVHVRAEKGGGMGSKDTTVVVIRG
jgi:hypothetical protein